MKYFFLSGKHLWFISTLFVAWIGKAPPRRNRSLPESGTARHYIRSEKHVATTILTLQTQDRCIKKLIVIAFTEWNRCGFTLELKKSILQKFSITYADEKETNYQSTVSQIRQLKREKCNTLPYDQHWIGNRKHF